MSTVLWANQLSADGKVISDESDKWALYKHAGKLDRLAKAAGLDEFSSLLDHTDLKFNLGEEDLPEGMSSTNQLMARDGVWRTAAEALAILEGLLAVISADQPRFGVLRNDSDAVITELNESIGWARQASKAGASFNFAVVM